MTIATFHLERSASDAWGQWIDDWVDEQEKDILDSFEGWAVSATSFLKLYAPFFNKSGLARAGLEAWVYRNESTVILAMGYDVGWGDALEFGLYPKAGDLSIIADSVYGDDGAIQLYGNAIALELGVVFKHTQPGKTANVSTDSRGVPYTPPTRPTSVTK